MAFSETISVNTKGFSDIIDITSQVTQAVDRSGIEDGLVTVFCPGSTGAVTSIEYESGVLSDLQKAIEKLAPSNIPYEHDRRWGDGNGFSHVRAAFMEPHGQARGPHKPYPPTPLGAEALRCAGAKASVGHPPVSEIRRSMVE